MGRLEAANVFGMVRGFRMEILAIRKMLDIHPSLDYADALWRNLLPAITNHENWSHYSLLLSQPQK